MFLTKSSLPPSMNARVHMFHSERQRFLPVYPTTPKLARCMMHAARLSPFSLSILEHFFMAFTCTVLIVTSIVSRLRMIANLDASVDPTSRYEILPRATFVNTSLYRSVSSYTPIAFSRKNFSWIIFFWVDGKRVSFFEGSAMMFMILFRSWAPFCTGVADIMMTRAEFIPEIR